MTTSKKPIPMAGAKGQKVHPLVALRDIHTPAEIAGWLGHSTHATVSIYVGRARKSRTLPIPAEWVLPICRRTGWLPYSLRPDLYLSNWKLGELDLRP
jgi:hypothetical protein